MSYGFFIYPPFCEMPCLDSSIFNAEFVVCSPTFNRIKKSRNMIICCTSRKCFFSFLRFDSSEFWNIYKKNWLQISEFFSSFFLLDHNLFWKRLFLPRYARVRHLWIRCPSTYPWILNIQDVNQALSCHHLHTLSQSSFFSPYISSLPPPPFYRLIPTHPHSYAPDAQATSILGLSKILKISPRLTVENFNG